MSEICEAKVKVIGIQQRLKPTSELACFYTLQGMTCVQAFLLVFIAVRFLNSDETAFKDLILFFSK